MALNLITPPALEPVSLAELKEFLRVDPDDTSQDNQITGLGLSARSWCETFIERKCVKQQWRLSIDFFPGYVNLKLVGEKISSPFVAGANAVLVGIRYAILLPLPPLFSVDRFIYQNANGQVTSMISPPVAISAISNPLGSQIGITTATPHGLISGASVLFAGNAALLALLGQNTEVITVLDPNNYTLNGTSGTGVPIGAGGTAQGFNFVQDILSNPARLMPVFGQMWPVARVVANAVQVDFTCGLAIPIHVSTFAGSPIDPSAVASSDYQFQSTDVGRPITIYGAGVDGGTLSTFIASVNNPPSSLAELRDPAQTAVASASALLVNSPYGDPSHWEHVRSAIKMLTERWYEIRIPDESNIPMAVKAVLWPVRDFRL